jgi:hypothetical protein
MRLPPGRNQRFNIGRYAHHHIRLAEIGLAGPTVCTAAIEGTWRSSHQARKSLTACA